MTSEDLKRIKAETGWTWGKIAGIMMVGDGMIYAYLRGDSPVDKRSAELLRINLDMERMARRNLSPQKGVPSGLSSGTSAS